MKVELELSLDANSKPCIEIRHHYKDSSLEQKTLKVFIDGVKKHGCELKGVSGHLNVSTGESWEDYEIQIKE